MMHRVGRVVAAVVLVVSLGAGLRALPAHAGGGSGTGSFSVVVLQSPLPTPQP